PSARRVGARRGRTDPRLIYGQPPRRPRPRLVRGHLLRIPDMRSRHAYIRQAAHRPAMPRRVVPTPTPAPRRRQPDRTATEQPPTPNPTGRPTLPTTRPNHGKKTDTSQLN